MKNVAHGLCCQEDVGTVLGPFEGLQYISQIRMMYAMIFIRGTNRRKPSFLGSSKGQLLHSVRIDSTTSAEASDLVWIFW